MEKLLDGADGIGVDFITVADVDFLRLIRRRHRGSRFGSAGIASRTTAAQGTFLGRPGRAT